MSDANQPPAPPAPNMQVIQFVANVMASRSVYIAAQLKLPDHVAKGPATAAELAAATGTHAPSLYRLLRAVASVGVFVEDEAGRFAMTPAAELLRSDAPVTLRPFLLCELSPTFHRAWFDGEHSVRTGEIAFNKAFGTDCWSYLGQHPDEAELFNRSMTGLTTAIEESVQQVYDFAGIRTLIDVGGGHGSLLAAILKRRPALRGIVFDQPAVVEGAAASLAAAGVADRCSAVGGSFFESVPSGADAAIMKFILHDWDDAQSARILATVHRALPPGGKLLLVESVIPKGNEPFFGKLMDVHMMVMTGGRERTAEEWKALLGAGGFELTRILSTDTGVSLIESRRRD